MALRHRLILILLGITVGFTGKYIKGFNKTSGMDFMPPVPEVASMRIPDSFSNNETFASFDQNVNRFLKKWQIAGASIAIAKDGNVVFAKGYGYSDKEDGIDVKPHNLFRTASISKLITATGIMKLMEEGKLDLNDKVFGNEGILSEFPYDNYIDKRVENIEVLHLLNHSGGWTTRWGDPAFMPGVVAKSKNVDLPVSEDDIITFALSKRLHFQPGSASSYSNLGYLILGKIIEKASGQDYETYIKENILYPLGIFDMKLGGSFLDERYPNEVKYYGHADSSFVDDFMGNGEKVPPYYGGNDIKTLGAAGGWIASATDLLKLMLAIDGNDKPADILSEESINLMANHEMLEFQPLGWRGIDEEGRYRTGTLSGTSTLMVCRDDGFSYVVLLNSSTWRGSSISNEVRNMMTRSILNIDEWPQYDLFELVSSVENISLEREVVIELKYENN